MRAAAIASHRKLKTAALLLFPSVSLNEATLDRVLAEGYAAVGAGVAITPRITAQGFSVEQSEQLAGMCADRGLEFIAFTGYMKYQDDLIRDEPQRVMRLAGRGQVRDLDGLRVKWLCPFRPENKARYSEMLRRIAGWPAVAEIHLNDEASLGFGNGDIGCYCDYCVETFRAATGHPPPLAPDWNDPVWIAWIERRMDGWVAVHAEMRAAIKAVRPDVRVGIQHSPYVPERVYNAWASGICLARDARAQDVIATDPYHYNHGDGIRYRPHRRILSETTRSLAGACLRDTEVVIYPQGFMPPSQAVPMGRGDGILAGVVPFALGAGTIMPFTYELMRIIPGFHEAFQETRRLKPYFETHEPYAFATAIMPQQSEIYGHPETNWGAVHLRELADMLHRTGLPWRWFWDQRLDDAGAGLTGPLAVCDAHALTAAQLAPILRVAATGQGVLWIGNTADGAWSGRGACPLPAPISYGAVAATITDTAHFATQGLTEPLVLSSQVPYRGQLPGGKTLATLNGAPALVVRDADGIREAWLSGVPQVAWNAPDTAPGTLTATANATILRRLLMWLAGPDGQPAARLDPFPPWDAYRDLRPLDYRAVPTIELLPMAAADSLLAIIYPYTPVATRTKLILSPPPGRGIAGITEVWRGEDWTSRVVAGADGLPEITVDLPGDADFLALLIKWI